MPDFNNPVSTQQYLDLLASIVENNKAALNWLDNVTGPLANLPSGAKRWNASNNQFEIWTGTSWVTLASVIEMTMRNALQLNGQPDTFYRDASNLNAGTLPAARFNDTAHGNRSGGSLHAAATTAANGFMSAADKAKLDGIEAGAQANPPFRGALAIMTASQTLNSLQTLTLPLDSESYDTDNIHDNATNNTRLTVPSGVSFVRLKASTRFLINVASDALVLLRAYIVKNGSTGYDGRAFYNAEVFARAPSHDWAVELSTPPLSVVAGDYFEFRVYQAYADSVNVYNNNTHFSMEIIE